MTLTQIILVWNFVAGFMAICFIKLDDFLLGKIVGEDFAMILRKKDENINKFHLYGTILFLGYVVLGVLVFRHLFVTLWRVFFGKKKWWE